MYKIKRHYGWVCRHLAPEKIQFLSLLEGDFLDLLYYKAGLLELTSKDQQLNFKDYLE